MNLSIRQALGSLSQFVDLSHSYCYRCWITWTFVREHTTWYRYIDGHKDTGCFALCEHCWKELTPIQRLPFYRMLFERWNTLGRKDVEWEEIDKAVRFGL